LQQSALKDSRRWILKIESRGALHIPVFDVGRSRPSICGFDEIGHFEVLGNLSSFRIRPLRDTTYNPYRVIALHREGIAQARVRGTVNQDGRLAAD
jgi:hypothetical protein